MLQISTMVRPSEFQHGEVLLSAGQSNDTLYFLRQGTVEVLVDNEKVNELSQNGEVLGEMSVLSGKPASATIRAKTKLECFAIHADDFAHVPPNQKDRFQFLLYRIYAGILTDRLTKTNEKAKMYEITARQLERAKKEIEVVSSAQMNFLRSESKAPSQNVLLMEPNKKQQNMIKTAVGSTGVYLHLCSTQDEAQAAIRDKSKNFDVVFCDETSMDFLRWLRDVNFQGEMVFLQSTKKDFGPVQELPFVQYVITVDSEDRAGTVKSLLTTLTKILNKDYFGLEKYLAWGTDTKTKVAKSSKDREGLRQELLSYFRSLGIRSALLDRVQVAVEEMLMNAIYDAPVDSEGRALYNHLPRTETIELNPQEEAILRYGCDGNMMAISVRDSFGAISRDTVLKYFSSCYAGAAGSLNENKGGAGRGLHQILESCDFTIFNVKKGYATEVIGLFDIEAAIQKRDSSPKFHFFYIK